VVKESLLGNKNSLQKAKTVRKKPATNTVISEIKIQSLLLSAIKNKSTSEVLDSLISLSERIKRRAAKKELFADLLIFQNECPIIKKNTNDGKGKYKYAPLEYIVSQVKDLLKKYHFSYSFKSVVNGNLVTATCYAHHKDGYSISSRCTIPAEFENMNKPQKFGSALSYAKRYAFCSVFGIIVGGEDDDAADLTSDGQGAGQEKSSGHPTDQARQDKKQHTQKSSLSSAPEENQEAYKNIMHAISAMFSGKQLFTNQEKTEHKKKADAVLNNLTALKDLENVLAKIVEDRILAERNRPN